MMIIEFAIILATFGLGYAFASVGLTAENKQLKERVASLEAAVVQLSEARALAYQDSLKAKANGK
jgi:hypothetical protein